MLRKFGRYPQGFAGGLRSALLLAGAEWAGFLGIFNVPSSEKKRWAKYTSHKCIYKYIVFLNL